MFSKSFPNLNKYLFNIKNDINKDLYTHLLKTHLFDHSIYSHSKVLKFLFDLNIIGYHLYDDEWVNHIRFNKFNKYLVLGIVNLSNFIYNTKINKSIEPEFIKFNIPFWTNDHADEYNNYFKFVIKGYTHETK